jgi:hypothetical protein
MAAIDFVNDDQSALNPGHVLVVLPCPLLSFALDGTLSAVTIVRLEVDGRSTFPIK